MLIISKETKVEHPELLLLELFMLPIIPLNDANAARVKTENTLTILQQETAIFGKSTPFDFVATRGLSSCVLIIFTLPDGQTLVTHYDGNENYDWDKFLSGYKDCEISLKLIGGLGSEGLDNIKKVLQALQGLSKTNNRTFNITHQRLQDSFYLEPSSAMYELNNYLFKKIGEAFEYYLGKGLPEDCSGLAFPTAFQTDRLDVYEKLVQITKDIPFTHVARVIQQNDKKLWQQVQDRIGLLMLLFAAQPKKVSEIDSESPTSEIFKMMMQNSMILDVMRKSLFSDPIAYQIARVFTKYTSGEERSYYSDVALSLKTGEICVLPHHQCTIGPNRLMRLLRTIALTLENNFVYHDFNKDGIPENFQISATMRKMLLKFIPHFKLNNTYIPKSVSDDIVNDFQVRQGSAGFMFILSVFAEVSRNEQFKEFRQQPVATLQTALSTSSTSTSSNTSGGGLRGGFFVTPTKPSLKASDNKVEQAAASTSSQPQVKKVEQQQAAPAVSQSQAKQVEHPATSTSLGSNAK